MESLLDMTWGFIAHGAGKKTSKYPDEEMKCLLNQGLADTVVRYPLHLAIYPPTPTANTCTLIPS